MGSGWLFGALIAVGVVLLIVLLVRLSGAGLTRDGREEQHMRGSSTARQLLDERYARGDLTTEEYQERVRILGEGT